MKTPTNRGGVRPGAGRPIADIQLDQDHARALKEVMQAQGLEYNPKTASKYVMMLIQNVWRTV